MSNPENSKLNYWIKQSEMLQSAIARMANNSLEIKKVGLTVWAAIVGFGFTNDNAALFVLAFVAFVLFGILDIYYLYLERRFRENFNRLTRLINGYGTREDEEWSKKAKGKREDACIQFPPTVSPTSPNDCHISIVLGRQCRRDRRCQTGACRLKIERFASA